MSWIIKAFETKRGEKPVEEFVKNLDESTIARVESGTSNPTLAFLEKITHVTGSRILIKP